jgi:hypothetical protein
MKWLTYGWTVLINLITLFIVFAIFEVVYGSFETIVCSLLILIFINLASFTAGYSQMTTKRIFMDHARYKKLRNLMQQHEDPNEMAAEADDEEKANITAKKNEVRFYINSVFNFIIYITAVFNILNSL